MSLDGKTPADLPGIQVEGDEVADVSLERAV